MEEESAVEIHSLKDKLAEASKEVHNLHTKFAEVLDEIFAIFAAIYNFYFQISSIIDEFKLEQVFNSFTTNFTSEVNESKSKKILTVDDLL